MASSSASKYYDVFLSFRGEDTRHSIVSHFYKALDSRGLFTFKDDERLEIGDRISDELRRAIEGSDNVIVVLSERYATSSWCLMELQLIMELQSQGRLRVFPVFYGVEPSALRHQRGSFDLETYQRDPKMADKVPMWREALKLIADISGVESKLCSDEATMVEKIAEDISRLTALKRKIDVSNSIVGAETHMQCLKSLLDMDSENDEVRMIGIWGMGGIGKTTIAKCLYNQISLQFEATCFTQDVKGIHRDPDLQLLQEKLLCETLTLREVRLKDVDAGRCEIKARLGRKKVLLVLDGVDKIGQVRALAKETSWFGPRSRIIITTRDWGLFRSCGVETVYEVKCLDDEDSLHMFKQIAFEGRNPPFDDFEQLSIRAARLAHGLPSALEAYALCLRERENSPEEWEAAVCGLENAPEEKIMEILKLSYLGLGQGEKNVFLEVACLFNGETYQRVISLLDNSYLRKGNLCVRVLAEKSLINITTNGYVVLHKLVEQMGKQLGHGCREFLGHPKKIQDALVHGDGTKHAECISLHICEMTDAVPMKTSVFQSMYHLKFLKVYKHVDDRESQLQVIQDINLSPYTRPIRLFHWDAFPLSTFPLKFDPRFLVELNLRHSNLETIWNDKLCLENLKKLDVTGSKNLKQLPDISSSKKLEELLLEQCTRLKGIPESIGHKSTLGRLSLSYNGGPENPMGVVVWEVSGTKHIALEFPTGTVEMELMNISIKGDIKFHFHGGCQGFAEYLYFGSEHHIPVTTTMSVQQAPKLISEFKIFEALNIRRFSYKEDGPPAAFDGFADIRSLKELKLINLNIQILSEGIGHLEFLQKLDLSGNDFENLPEALSKLSRLKTLWLQNCVKLKELPELAQVQSLTLFNCPNLRSLVKYSSPAGRYCLLELCLDNCKNVNSLSDQLSHLTKLTYLDLSSHDFETLPSSVTDLTSLVTLCINNCKNLKSVEVLPLSLQFVNAHGCDSLEADALNHFEGRLNKKAPEQPQSACFQETKTQSFKRDHRDRKSRLPKFIRCS